jgi:hypothetical protein
MRPRPQPERHTGQHDGRLTSEDAQDDPALSIQPYPTSPLPAATSAAMASCLLLPIAEYTAATSCAIWTVIHHGSAPSAARHRHDELRRAVSPKRNDPPAANAPAGAAQPVFSLRSSSLDNSDG